MITIRIEYRDGTFVEYDFRDGRAYWTVVEVETYGKVRIRQHSRHSTTRMHALGYVGHCMRTPLPCRVVAIRNNRMRVLRAS